MVVVGAAVVVVVAGLVVVVGAGAAVVVVVGLIVVVVVGAVLDEVVGAEVAAVAPVVVVVVATWPVERTGVGVFVRPGPSAVTPMRPVSAHTESCAAFGQERKVRQPRFRRRGWGAGEAGVGTGRVTAESVSSSLLLHRPIRAEC